jgi:hypothetical protein
MLAYEIDLTIGKRLERKRRSNAREVFLVWSKLEYKPEQIWHQNFWEK